MKQLNNNPLVKACRALGVIQVRTRTDADGKQMTESRMNPWHPITYIIFLIPMLISKSPDFINRLKLLSQYLGWEITKLPKNK